MPDKNSTDTKLSWFFVSSAFEKIFLLFALLEEFGCRLVFPWFIVCKMMMIEHDDDVIAEDNDDNDDHDHDHDDN